MRNQEQEYPEAIDLVQESYPEIAFHPAASGMSLDDLTDWMMGKYGDAVLTQHIETGGDIYPFPKVSSFEQIQRDTQTLYDHLHKHDDHDARLRREMFFHFLGYARLYVIGLRDWEHAANYITSSMQVMRHPRFKTIRGIMSEASRNISYGEQMMEHYAPPDATMKEYRAFKTALRAIAKQAADRKGPL